MKVLCFSEHFIPRVGGTVNYVHETCTALSERGVNVELAVPGPQVAGLEEKLNYRVTWLDADYPAMGDPTRNQRYAFCSKAQQLVKDRLENSSIDVVHVLFGLFLMEVLDTKAIKRAGVKSVVTVHNVPPLECSLSWDGAAWNHRMLNSLRLQAVKAKNRFRLRRNHFSIYVTPSQQVRKELSHVLPTARVEVIGHGTTSMILDHMNPPMTRRAGLNEVVHLFTAGGWAPHKRQHLIPKTAAILRDKGMKFVWTVAGPSSRVPGYREAVEKEISLYGLGASIQTLGAVTDVELASFYDWAHLYVQPSTEEGFCLTALDAAAVGLPVIASPAGALPEICEASCGCVFPSLAVDLAEGIFNYVKNQMWPNAPLECAKIIKTRFSWARAATNLIDLYSIPLVSGIVSE